MFRFFERQVDPYPDAPPATPPKSFFAFLWQASEGVRPWMLATTLLTAAIGAFEAYLFSMMGSIVDWLSTVPPAELWTTERERLLFLGAVLAGSVLLVVLQSTIKQQVIFGNFPMLLRWKFHRLMLGQSMAFYQDEFAGRIATKVMQTALAVREVWLIVAEMLVFVTIYFVTLLSVLGGFDGWLIGPFLAWVALYAVSLSFFVPRLGKIAEKQADARSIMTGRIVDSYTNIQTVKLFAHSGREESYARDSMSGFLDTVHGQMRLVTGFNVIVYLNNSLLVFLIAASGILSVDRQCRRRRRSRGRRRPCPAHESHVAMDHVGSRRPLREYRRRL